MPVDYANTNCGCKTTSNILRHTDTGPSKDSARVNKASQDVGVQVMMYRAQIVSTQDLSCSASYSETRGIWIPPISLAAALGTIDAQAD